MEESHAMTSENVNDHTMEHETVRIVDEIDRGTEIIERSCRSVEESMRREESDRDLLKKTAEEREK